MLVVLFIFALKVAYFNLREVKIYTSNGFMYFDGLDILSSK